MVQESHVTATPEHQIPGHRQNGGARIPHATYRLQFTPSFTFAEAARLVPYLSTLGVSDCYASPYFKACPGSPHGYDVIDHNTLNPEIGTEEDYDTFVQKLQHHGMGQILDVVPNHMGITRSLNAWWTDVLENGPSSLYASYFDIDWMPVKPELANKVLLPILGDQYGQVLENQELTIRYEEGAFFLFYYDHRLPIAPRPATAILTHRLGDLEHELGADHPHLLEFRSIITALHHLPLRTETDRDKVIERNREKEIIKRRLATLTTTNPEIRTFVEGNVRFFNGTKSDPRSFTPLDTLLSDQAYRLAYWRVAVEEINYRRFFDINELAAIRTEDPAVFAATHQLVLRLLAEGKVTGLRIDHVDGLYDPAGYIRRLQHAAGMGMRAEAKPGQRPVILSGEHAAAQQPDTDSALSGFPYYTVVEKILGPGEHLPEHWPVHGTTGYEFLSMLNGVFVDQDNEKHLTDIYARFIHTRVDFSNLVYESKKLIMQGALSSEMNMLGHQLNRLSEKNRHARDFTLNSLTHTIQEVIACFPVYRTYLNGDGVIDRDRTIIELAVAHAKRRNPARENSVFNYLREVLLLRYPDGASEEDRQAQQVFVMKFQQCTSPVMAKSVEDTACYRYNRLVSLNEVGGAPDRFGTSIAELHDANRERLQHWPHALLATTTHDTKRSEDVRARINVLSEIPAEWRAALRRWSKLNQKKKPRSDDQPVPDRNEEYLFYQTLLGTWPPTPMNADEYTAFKQRIQDYMRKATKEAKVNTSWINPHLAYDDAVQDFVSQVLDDFLFRDDFHRFRIKIARYGMYNSLAQTVLKLTAPGVPDMYQGTELWDFSLVDPDSRRPVDYDQRRQLLGDLQAQLNAATGDRLALVESLLKTWEDGRIKLYVTQQALTYRRCHPDLFRGGQYIPIEATGIKRKHICAFARRLGHQTLFVVAPRLLTEVIPDPAVLPIGSEVWADTWLVLPPNNSDRHYQNLFTRKAVTVIEREGRWCLALGEVLAHFPVALLAVGEEELP
jgi:(1->4)-alpha-D-glucan 1-alpha-D-glucosylmutase